MKKRALILRGGTMKGAFTAGAINVFYEKFGSDYFDAIYSNSVGIFEQVFYAARQPQTIENTWANYVGGRRLIDFSDIFRGGPILKLDYLTDLFKSELSKLDVGVMLNSKSELFCNVTAYDTREHHILNLKEKDIFAVMRATCAIPILYNRKVLIDGRRYIDGSISMNKAYATILKGLKDNNYEEIIVIVNKKGVLVSDAPNIKILEPSSMPLWHWFDTNQQRIRATINQGKKDAEAFIRGNL